MRTNRNGVTEVASLRTDIEKYDSNFDDIFMKKWTVTYQVNGCEASDSITVTESSEIAAKRAASERISEIMAMGGEHASFQILFVKPEDKTVLESIETPVNKVVENIRAHELEKEKGIEINSALKDLGEKAGKALSDERMRIKNLARKSYQSLDMSTGCEGLPESSSYVYGFMEGFTEAQKELLQDALRWRAFFGSHYIKMWGSGQLGNPKNQHVGFEIWDVLPEGYMSEESIKNDKSAKEQILTYVDTIIKRGLK